MATFKDELVKMLPHDDDAMRLARNTYHFAEFFREREVEPPRLEGDALLWGHCHHKATGGMDPEEELLRQMGLDVQEVTGGCCGLAGSWGFESGHYDVSMQVGEAALLPAVRDAGAQTVVVANGFSCKTQIEQAGTGRKALHVAQAMRLAREHGSGRPLPAKPEQEQFERPAPSPARRAGRAAAIVGLAAAAAAGAFALRSFT